MSELTAQEAHERRRNAAGKLAAGGAMIGGATAIQRQVSRKTGIKGPVGAVKDIARTKRVSAKHGKYAAGWLGTRGVIAAGAPLAAVGAKNLLTTKPKHVDRLDLKEDVINESAYRTVGRTSPRTHQRKFDEALALTAGTAGGAAGGGAIGHRVAPAKFKLLGTAAGSAVGATSGVMAATPVARRMRRNKEKTPLSKVNKTRSDDAAINTLAQREQRELLRRKKKQTRYSLTSAGLGATALALQAPRLAPLALKSKRLANSGALKRIATAAPKTTNASSTIGIGSLGVGSVGSLNYARINRSETKAEGRSANALKVKKMHLKGERDRQVDVAKALLRVPQFPKRPPGFAGVKPGGLRMIRNPYTGMQRQVTVRGSVG